MRGGKREKAGRKSTWVSGCKFEDTKLIRVPAAIAVQLLDLAHKLDAGDVLDSETKPKKKAAKTEQKTAPLQKNHGVACPICFSTHLQKRGIQRGRQKYMCSTCKKLFMESTAVKLLDSVTNQLELETNSNE